MLDSAASPTTTLSPVSPAKTGVESLEQCLDRRLSEAGLNRFGDPADTMYAGGTPLFDERTGTTTDRVTHLRARRPDLVTQCEKATP